MVKKVLARRSQRSRAQAVSSRDWWALRGRHPVRLRQVAFVGFHRVRDIPSQLAGLCTQGPAGDAQHEGGPGLLPAGLPQDAGQQQPIASFRAGADGRFSRLVGPTTSGPRFRPRSPSSLKHRRRTRPNQIECEVDRAALRRLLPGGKAGLTLRKGEGNRPPPFHAPSNQRPGGAARRPACERIERRCVRRLRPVPIVGRCYRL